MTAVKDFVKNWWAIFLLAWACLYEEFMLGETPSCIPCWKCRLMRYLMLSAAFVGLYVGILWLL
jgi:hypothetical protein